MLSCNFLNEGCSGGQPIFNSFFGENAYLVSEICAPYNRMTKGQTCEKFEKCKPIAKVKSSHIVGGGYAQVTEKQMMKDILRNGPTTGDFQADEYFGAYKSGILSEAGILKAKNLM